MGLRTTGTPSRSGARLVAVGAVALALLAVGCDSDDGPTPSPSASASSASPTPSVTTSPASPTPTATSDIPEAARKKTDAGAEAFARYFFEQVNAAWMAPNPDLIARLSDRGCKSCDALAKTATDLQKNGQRYREIPIDIVSVSTAKDSPSGQQYVDASLVQNESNVIDGAGKIVLNDPREEFKRTVALSWTGDQWTVFDVG